MSPELTQKIGETLDMFAFLAVELTVLFLVVSYLVGVLQEYITPEKIRRWLSSRNGRGHFIAAFLGAITPFCSCSTIPFLKGLLKARAGFGPMMVFLFASPLLNPVIIGLLIATFGLDVAVLYFSIAMFTAITAGFVLEKLGFQRFIREDALGETVEAVKSAPVTAPASVASASLSMEGSHGTPAFAMPGFGSVSEEELATAAPSCGANSGSSASTCGASARLAQEQSRWMKIWHSTWKDFKKTLPYLLLGITIGSLIYGFVPTDLIVEYAGENKWYAIPVAAVIGIPLYIRASAVIPLSVGLVQKGMAMGSVLALIIGSAGASLTEVILLRSLFKTQLIAAFLTVVLGMAMFAGYAYGLIF